MNISELDESKFPTRIYDIRFKDGCFLAAFKDLSSVHIFNQNGDFIVPMGSIDCTKIVYGELEEFIAKIAIQTTHDINPDNIAIVDLKQRIASALSAAQSLNQSEKTRSRELSLTITKLEEAQMWLEKAIANSGASGIPS